MIGFRKPSRLLALAALALASGAAPFAPVVVSAQTSGQASGIDKINHVIVIYQENWSFDGLYGSSPARTASPTPGDASTQVDKNGQPYATLPQPIDTSLKPPGPDPRFPANLPVPPFDVSQYVAADREDRRPGPPLLPGAVPDRRRQDGQVRRLERRRRPGRWATTTPANMPEGKLAQQYTMADNFFHAAFGGSFLNHFWLICACTPTWPNAPAAHGRAARRERRAWSRTARSRPTATRSTPRSPSTRPHPANITDTTKLVPEQTAADDRRPAEREGHVAGPGTRAAGTTRWPASPTRCSSSTTSRSPTSPTTPTARPAAPRT